ncbi:hypothetical protein HYV86_03970 [Candidatus Woesearchaeota archaeon]|nr:hypothetical protein [Candidatus Woesearchaeota archaeon]
MNKNSILTSVVFFIFLSLVSISALAQLQIEKIEVNGNTDGDLEIEENNEFEITVQNNANISIEDVQVTVTILDVDSEDIDENSDEEDIRSGDDEKFTVDIDLSGEDLDKDSFEVEVLVEGEDNNGVEYSTVENITVGLDLENHQLIIDRAVLAPSTLQCSRTARLEVTVENQGKSDEDDVVIRVSNSQLNLEAHEDEIDIDEFTENNNDVEETFLLNFENAKAGTYILVVQVFRDENKLADTQEVTLKIQDCAQSATTTTPERSQYTISNSQDYAQQLQRFVNQQTVQTKPASTSTTPAVQPNVLRASFRESDTYVAMLGILLVLGFIALILAVTVMLAKRKR